MLFIACMQSAYVVFQFTHQQLLFNVLFEGLSLDDLYWKELHEYCGVTFLGKAFSQMILNCCDRVI